MIYQIILERLLVESKYDSVASSITRKVMDVIKKSMEKINASEEVATSDGISAREFTTKIEMTTLMDEDDELMTIVLPIQLIVQRSKTQNFAGITATAPKGQIIFQIKVFSKTGTLLPMHLSLIQEKLYEAARHELEHLFQEEDPTTSASAQSFFEKPQVLSRRLAYYTHPQETPAFVSGMYMRAKKMRKPFIEIVEENLEKIRKGMLFRGNTPEQTERLIDKIRRNWISYAKKRYPRAQI